MIYLLKEREIRDFTEIGSGRVLSGLMKRTARDLGYDVNISNIQNLEDLKKII